MSGLVYYDHDRRQPFFPEVRYFYTNIYMQNTVLQEFQKLLSAYNLVQKKYKSFYANLTRIKDWGANVGAGLKPALTTGFRLVGRMTTKRHLWTGTNQLKGPLSRPLQNLLPLSCSCRIYRKADNRPLLSQQGRNSSMSMSDQLPAQPLS